MRILVALLLAPVLAHAQIVGWLDCKHDAPGEKFGYIRIVLMDGNREMRTAVRDFSVLKAGANDIAFREVEGPAQVTGMRLGCEIITAPTSDLESEETQYTLNWRKKLVLADGEKAKPVLRLMLTQTSVGWRAYIGKAP